MSLALHTVSAGYGALQVLWDVELEVNAGEIVSLLGRNGVGKSTTLKSVFGLADLFGGEVWIRGHQLGAPSTRNMARLGVGYIAQEREICPDLSVEENLRLPLFATGRSLRTIEHIYSQFPCLRTRARQRAGSLSGGERKLLAFGRIMLLQPSIYLVDEPTEGLMPHAVKEIGRLIRRLRDDGATVLLVEQNLDLVRNLSDRIYLMNSGRVETCVQTLDDSVVNRFLAL
ncbi:MAG: ABC transporter ATP-binding protein [Burkholderiales bacterium]|nr:ABC transporter ATP-binding protein [Burkholderiales bacterium]